jgi:hypothetical protein
MITSENLKFCFDNLTKKDIKQLEKKHDCLKFELHIFNTGSFSTIKSCDYSEKKETKLSASGNLFLDKDTFLQLFIESGSKNKFLQKYI